MGKINPTNINRNRIELIKYVRANNVSPRQAITTHSRNSLNVQRPRDEELALS